MKESKKDVTCSWGNGISNLIKEEELKKLVTSHQTISYDEHGHLRLAELNFSDIVKYALLQRLEEFGLKMRVVDQEIGYELRCIAPCAYDIDYTRNLGFGAVEFLEGGNSAAMITIQGDLGLPRLILGMTGPGLRPELSAFQKNNLEKSVILLTSQLFISP